MSDSILDSEEILNREKESVVSTRKVRKTPVTFHIKLTEEQKEAKRIAIASRITVLTGKPGTSKTTVMCQFSLDLLIKGEIDKIYVTRPTVEVGKTQGYQPGDSFDFKEGKMAPYMGPIIECMCELRSEKEIDEFIKKGKIIIMPVQFMRGRNLKSCVLMVDEAQNLTKEELVVITTRLCKDGRIIFTSDLNQVDLLDPKRSAGNFFSKIAHLDGVSIFELTHNFRDPLAISIMEELNKE
jgi:phosphate starvation-inducible PhoH-like protein